MYVFIIIFRYLSHIEHIPFHLSISFILFPYILSDLFLIPFSSLINFIYFPVDRSLPPVILADHFDTAYCQEIFEKTGNRVSAPGADDNGYTKYQPEKSQRVSKRSQEKETKEKNKENNKFSYFFQVQQQLLF